MDVVLEDGRNVHWEVEFVEVLSSLGYNLMGIVDAQPLPSLLLLPGP